MISTPTDWPPPTGLSGGPPGSLLDLVLRRFSRHRPPPPSSFWLRSSVPSCSLLLVLSVLVYLCTIVLSLSPPPTLSSQTPRLDLVYSATPRLLSPRSRPTTTDTNSIYKNSQFPHLTIPRIQQPTLPTPIFSKHTCDRLQALVSSD